MTEIARLRGFVQDMTRLVETVSDEPPLLDEGAERLAALVSHDDWLPAAFAVPHPDHYQQYLLYCDPWERFSVVSFVWGPGQTTPVHDHTVWGLVGVMRGNEVCQEFDRSGAALETTGEHAVSPGEVDRVSPRIGDIHRVSNALADAVSLSIHVYGANIGAVRRHVFDEGSGAAKAFVSGYSSDVVPNLWDRSQGG